MNSTTKAWIAAAVGILFSIALIAWQVKAGRGVVSLSPEDMALIVADQQPQARARMASDEKARKDFAKNVREILAVAEEARLKGLAYRPDLKRQLDLARTFVIARNYLKSQSSNPAATNVSDADIEAFFKEPGQEERFNQLITDVKAENPQMAAQQIPEDQLKEVKHQLGQALLLERRGIAAGIDKQRSVELQIMLEQAVLLERKFAEENLDPKKNPSMKATDPEIDEYLKTHPAEQIHARHILISAGSSGTPDASKPANPAEKAQARAKAEEVLKRVRAGEDFASLAKQFSSDPGSKDNGGDLGWFGHGQMVPEFEKAAFALQPGQISDVVESQFGFHIIKLEERRSGDREQAAEAVEQEKEKKWIEDIVNRSHVTVAENFQVTAPQNQPQSPLFAPGGPEEGPVAPPAANEKKTAPPPVKKKR